MPVASISTAKTISSGSRLEDSLSPAAAPADMPRGATDIRRLLQ